MCGGGGGTGKVEHSVSEFLFVRGLVTLQPSMTRQARRGPTESWYSRSVGLDDW